MAKKHSFTIYNASAGSGKTFTLVKEYLKILLHSNHLYLFKNILAITFTNKAVAEMKERIINTLREFSKTSILENPNDMFNMISTELGIEPKTLNNKAKKLLNTIIHNYAAFDISTIDGFTHKLIRTFAHDLKLPLNFEVELDQDALLNEAVDKLIDKAGNDDALTKVLVDFAIEKADDDKSWDLSFDFNKIAKLLVNENDLPYIKLLKDKTLEDFKILKTQLKKEVITLEKDIVETSKSILTLIEAAGLEFNDFSGSYLPKHFKKLSDKTFNVNFEAKWQENLESKTLYPKRVTNDIASIIEEIQPKIAIAFNSTKQAIFKLRFSINFYKNITPLSVLNAINNELNVLKIEQNKMLISEFNSIISHEIKDQPTPFIYERIGEKFKHYFIDEFQDTSVMQWDNLIPLLSNSLSTETGSAMLVGDAKQAIYRWRGGKAEQFIGLFNKDNPFFIDKQVKNLPANYRSFKEIVNFNNDFFKFLSNQVFSKTDYKLLYEHANQDISKNDNGYVELSFLNIEKDDDRHALFSEHVLNTINNCLKHNYELKDICILVRKKKEGVALANYLSQHKIPIISSETLLINNSLEVNFINDFLALLIQPNNNEIKISILNYLVNFFKIEDKHDFFNRHINLSIHDLFKSLETYGIFVNTTLVQLPLYDLAESIVRMFNLVKTSNAYIQFYLDVVLDFSQKKGSNISAFLAYYEKKKESLSIVSPVGQNAVQIMTIHKSKGLEFPIVIFPYADLDIYRELEPKEWYTLDEKKYNGFSHTLLSYNKDFEYFGNIGFNIHAKHKSEQELDNINLLYVALTRPVEQLYVISKNDTNAKKYSGLLINYLKHIGTWNDSQLSYSFGKLEMNLENSTNTNKTSIQKEFISTSKEENNIKVITKSGLLWDTNQQEAIEKGNLVHNIMSYIKTKDDIDFVIQEFINTSIINLKQSLILKQWVIEIVEHPKLKNFYNSNHIIYNERDIITKEGFILRPDRVVINSNNEVTIIDYKTGIKSKKHEQQLLLYQDVLENMRLIVKNKILIYINKKVEINIF